MNKKKICFIAQFPPPIHGLSKAVETLFKSELQKEFIFEKVDITKNKNIIKNLITILNSNADLFYFTISQTRGGNLRDLIILKILVKLHKKCIIHLHGGFFRNLVDNYLPSWQRNANYEIISKLQGAVVLSESFKKIFQGMINDKDVFVVPNCVDDDVLLSKVEFEEKLAGLKRKDIKHILFLSNFIKAKGYPVILELAKLEKERVIKGEKRRYHFDFAGKFFEKNEKQFFENYVSKNKLQPYITYHGIVGGEKKKNLMKNCDIFMLPTRYIKEGQPISILEAMGNGMMIVTTDHAGIPDIVKDGENGVVLRKRNNIIELFDKLEIMPNILINNRYKVCAHYKEKNYCDNFRIIFRRLLK
ncbi:glycosyltransferase family 4 protein [Sporolactobacillus kofuensis]|uniref:Glycosyltransferase family 4 protein n=1 Tax=Sporolactobacillus kofuensis TaxID=269672 RepID=A0ABW1WJ77_9BACL|nr:glycosyltransferase family 4 protein [Sporolactobacillus kofuensis]MCO7177095.1 glycosyltransferase family 4 protein [Sporolactobacillus kofuensis]